MSALDPYAPQTDPTLTRNPRIRQSLLQQMTDDPTMAPLAGPRQSGPLAPSPVPQSMTSSAQAAPLPPSPTPVAAQTNAIGAVASPANQALAGGMTTNVRAGSAPTNPNPEPPNPGGTVTTPTAPNDGTRTPGSGSASTGALPPTFTSASTAQDLISFLNNGHLDPQTAQSIVQKYAQAKGLVGNQGNPNGMNWGDYDAQRQKYYVPGYDIRYENGQWVAHAWGAGGATDTGTAQASVNLSPEDAAFQAQLRDSILKMMGDASKPVDMNDPTLANAVNAYRVPRMQAATAEREALAERAAAEGLNSGGQGSGAYDTAVQGGMEQAGRDVAGQSAGIALNELNNRRTQLNNALQLANAYGARQEATQLQLALANLDAQIRQQQFEDNMAYNYAGLDYQRNRDAILYGLNG